jgi:hypothetical protein
MKRKDEGTLAVGSAGLIQIQPFLGSESVEMDLRLLIAPTQRNQDGVTQCIVRRNDVYSILARALTRPHTMQM